MADMTAEQRLEAYAAFMQRLSSERQAMVLSKPDLRAALNAADSWVDANRASYNAALPAAAQAGLTAPQKARLLGYVVAKRYDTGAF